MELDPEPGTKKGKELRRLAKAVAAYEIMHFPITKADHSKRRIWRSDLLEKKRK